MSAKRIIAGADELASLVGTTIGVSDWRVIDQPAIDAFARVTGDVQWIHVDPERAAAGPFGGTIAHGFFVLSLIPVLANQVYVIEGFGARVNYGLDKARFPRSLRAGEGVRDAVSIIACKQTPTGMRVVFGHRLEVLDTDRPVCVAETVTLFVP